MRALQTLFALSILMAFGTKAQSLLTVRVYNYTASSGNTIAAAESIAEGIFRRTGIETEWVHCPTDRNEEDRYPACRQPRGPWDVILHVVPRSMEPRKVVSDAFGFALPAIDAEPSTHAYVFFHRAEKAAMDSQRSSRPISLPTLMACVIVHEVGHLILGPNMHSTRGIMRARWEQADLQEIAIGGLTFTPDEARRLRVKLGDRMRERNPLDD